jgi:hypothetical protein
MKFSFKSVIKSFIVILLSSHPLLASEGDSSFLLPKGSEDPLKLGHFLHCHAPQLIPFYERIQVAKAAADTEALLSVKEALNTLGESEGNWQSLAYRLNEEVKGDPVELWPGQSAQQCIVSVLFYPQELIGNNDSSFLCYPGLAASLAISADMGNPVAIYQLSRGYSNLARECRKSPKDIDEEMKISAQDRKQSTVLKAVALWIFTQAAVTNKVAEFYTMQSAYEEDRMPLERFVAYLEKAELPEAYFELGYLYANRRLCPKKDKIQNQSRVPEEIQLAYLYYCRALQSGYQEAIRGIHRLLSAWEVGNEKMKPLYEKASGLGLFLAAERQKERRNFEEAKGLYKRSGDLGYLYSYIMLGKEILLDNIFSDNPEKEATFYYVKADKPGYAEGSRIISGHPDLCTDDTRLGVLKHMIRLKDLTGYRRALICADIKKLSLEDLKTYPAQDLQRDFQNLLLERGKILAIVNRIGTSS